MSKQINLAEIGTFTPPAGVLVVKKYSIRMQGEVKEGRHRDCVERITYKLKDSLVGATGLLRGFT